MKLDPERATLIVVDVQEAFRRAVPEFAAVATATATLVEGARILGLPIIVSEQYPRGLGDTVAEVAERLPADARRLEKLRFSVVEAEGFELGDRDQAIVCGIEAHVCVCQSVLDLLDADVETQVAIDAVGSRTSANREVGLAKMDRAGALPTSVELALFELLGGADADRFKSVQALVK